MSNIYFIGDPHIGHRNIIKYRGMFGHKTELEHRQWIMDNWQSVVKPRDKVFVMGDAAFDVESLAEFGKLHGTKVLVRGNHDDRFNAKDALEYFEDVHGMIKYKKLWLTHCPMHPNELWGKVNIHGHVHTNTVNDPNYYNVSAENINGTPISLEQLRINIAENAEEFKLTGKIKHG